MLIAARGGARRTTTVGVGGLAAFLSQALRPAFSEKDIEMFARRVDFEHRILRDDATIVFYFHVELIVRQNSGGELKDFRETVRAQPVLDVVADVGLKNNRFNSPGEAATIDEVFHDVTYLGDVGMRGNDISIGQDKTGKRVGMLFEDFSESREFHMPDLYSHRRI